MKTIDYGAVESKKDEDEDMDQDMEMEDEMEIVPVSTISAPIPSRGNIKVVSDYKPNIGATSMNKSKVTFVDPLTGIPLDPSQSEKHLKIELLDPKW